MYTRKHIQRLLLTLLMVVFPFGLGAQEAETDTLEVSLLTCSPGTKVYQLYGHTALRVCDPSRGMDLVFNYGVFDFRAPHFTWRFMLGECDYLVAPYSFSDFLSEYRVRGSSVTEQVLNLTHIEALQLCSNLLENIRPENRTYRYNFLTNNCTTRARDMVEGALEGEVAYPENDTHPTYRQLLHRYTADYPWAEQGNDILLGATCDTVLTDRAAQFLPELLMASVDGAQVFDEDGNRRPLVRTRRVLLEANPQLLHPAAEVPRWPWLTPFVAGLMALGLALLVVLVEWLTRRIWWLVDVLLMSLQGLAGILLCFMFLFSQHPTVDANWQVWLFNPLPLLCLPWVVRCARQRRVCLYHYMNLLWLTLFVVFSFWVPQDFSALTLPLALVLLTRPISYYLNYNRA